MNHTDQQAAVPASHSSGPDAFKTALEQAGARVLAAHSRLEGCEILGLIGAGEFGVVYLAYDYALAQHVAVKEYMPASLAARESNGRLAVQARADQELFDMGLRSFLSEARLLARFDAPSLVKILRVWEANGTAYMAMSFHEGISLQDAIGSGRFDANEKRIRLLLDQLLDTVEMLHRAHCYHPDIAPGNILLLADGRPLLLDFGAARRVITAHSGGPAAALRPGYAPIEDYEDIPNLKRGPWTDIYALAAVAYFAIAGTAPPPAVARMNNDAMTPARQAGAARYGEAFLAAIDQALAVMPQQRPQSIADFRRALGTQAVRRSQMTAAQVDGNDTSTLRWTETLSGSAAPATSRGQSTQRGDRSGPGRAALPLLVLALVAVAGAGYWGLQRTDPTTTTTAPIAGQAGDRPDGARAPASAPASASASAPASASAEAPRAVPPPAATLATPEDNRWLVASSLNNASAYENYLAEYPNGRYAPMARATLDGLRAGEAQTLSVQDVATQEESLWNAVRKIDKPLAYESFLRKYPGGRYASTARSSLARLRPALADPRPSVDPSVVDATRRPPFNGGPYNEPGDRPRAAPPQVTPASPVPAPASATTPPDRVAAIRPPETPPAVARLPQSGDLAVDTEPEQEVASAPPPARTGRTLRLSNQTMTGNFSADPVSGLVSGSGRIVWDNGDQFEGTMVRGIKEGRGEFRWANGQRYSGEWSRDQPNGKGTIQFPNGDRYTGDVRNGLANGGGTLVFANGNRYQGEVRDGQPNGNGNLTFSSGNRYRGELRDGLPQGNGSIRFANGDSYSGAWRRGRSDGQGRYTWSNGNYWEGEFRDDAKTANGQMVVAGAAPAGASSSGSGDSPRGSAAGGSGDVEPDVGGRVR